MANCAVCKEDIQSRAVCPRCGVQDKGPYDFTFGYFASIWAILSFLLILAPLFMLLPKVLSWMESIFWLPRGGGGSFPAGWLDASDVGRSLEPQPSMPLATRKRTTYGTSNSSLDTP